MAVIGLGLNEEAQIIQRIRAAQDARESGAAFLALYDAYFSRVYTYFRYRCPDLQACDDLTAHTFEQALVHLEEYNPNRGPVAAWLFGIARNAANQYFRRKFRFQWLALDRFMHLAGNEPAPEEQVITKDQRERLLEAITHLPDRQRDLLALKFSGGLTNREISTLTGLGEGNVAVILHRSIQTLRQMIGGEDE